MHAHAAAAVAAVSLGFGRRHRARLLPRPSWARGPRRLLLQRRALTRASGIPGANGFGVARRDVGVFRVGGQRIEILPRARALYTWRFLDDDGDAWRFRQTKCIRRA